MSDTNPELENKVCNVTGTWLQMRQLLRVLANKQTQKIATNLYALSDVEFFITQIMDAMNKTAGKLASGDIELDPE